MNKANLYNGQAINVDSIPDLGLDAFRSVILAEVAGGSRIISFFGQKILPGEVRLYSITANDSEHSLSAVTTRLKTKYESLTPQCPQVHLFEREVFEQTGLLPEGHPWLKPVRSHDSGVGNSAFKESRRTPNHSFFTMEGEELHEVAVGPVHAGVIEPGHFRFQCHGEIVHHLEIHLGYQHRGVEEALRGGPHKNSMIQMETVAGDTTIGHAMAYCEMLESLGGTVVTQRSQALRAVALELERLANHVGDLGAISNDIGYLPTSAYCGRLRGDLLNMTAEICGSRLGRGMVRPGGVAFDFDQHMIEDLTKRLDKVEKELKGTVDQFFDTRSVISRLEGTGIVPIELCRVLGLVGLVGRASGCSIDARSDHPSGWYRVLKMPASIGHSGDVLARAKVRWLEMERSLVFVKRSLSNLSEGEARLICSRPKPNQLAVAIVEGWRGEIVHVAVTDADGKFARYKVTDPSFHNWMALAMSMRGEAISDFPLCNKSFNLSYCGFDL